MQVFVAGRRERSRKLPHLPCTVCMLSTLAPSPPPALSPCSALSIGSAATSCGRVRIVLQTLLQSIGAGVCGETLAGAGTPGPPACCSWCRCHGCCCRGALPEAGTRRCRCCAALPLRLAAAAGRPKARPACHWALRVLQGLLFHLQGISDGARDGSSLMWSQEYDEPMLRCHTLHCLQAAERRQRGGRAR